MGFKKYSLMLFVKYIKYIYFIGIKIEVDDWFYNLRNTFIEEYYRNIVYLYIYIERFIICNFMWKVGIRI